MACISGTRQALTFTSTYRRRRTSARKQQKGWKTEPLLEEKRTPKTSFLLHLESKPFGYFQCIFPKSGSCHISPKSPGFAPKARIEQALVFSPRRLGVWGSPGGERASSGMHSSGQQMMEAQGHPSGWGPGRALRCQLSPSVGWWHPQPRPRGAESHNDAHEPSATSVWHWCQQKSTRSTQVTGLSPPQHTHSPPNTWHPAAREDTHFGTPSLSNTIPYHHQPSSATVPGLSLWVGWVARSHLPSHSHSSSSPCWKVESKPSAQGRDIPGAPKEGLLSLMVTPGLKIYKRWSQLTNHKFWWDISPPLFVGFVVSVKETCQSDHCQDWDFHHWDRSPSTVVAPVTPWVLLNEGGN